LLAFVKQTELSTCWAARTTAESKVTQLQAEIDVLKQRNEASEAELEIAHAKLQDQLAALDSLRREAEFNCENATLFRTEQERCMALSAELHDLQAAKVQELTEATELNAELSTALQTEREKVASLKVRFLLAHSSAVL
jgi:DNA repair exonuclease SbcCD ATPase subunit